MARRNSPVFIVGCHRSGTNLLYDMLLSSGGFAIFRAAPFVYETLIPRFGDPGVLRNRERLMEFWLRSEAFRRSGLDAEDVKPKVMAGCRSGGEFLRIVMDEIARHQSAIRWAYYGPDCLLYMPRIKKELPGALFIHIIRDGRDIAVSLTKMQGIRPLPWDTERALFATALYWNWVVSTGRRYGRKIASDYIEVHYEDLVAKPQETLVRLGKFIDHTLDYERIKNAGIGRVSVPNSSFRGEARGQEFNPVNRWKQKLSANEIVVVEQLIGGCLRECGYPLATSEQSPSLSPGVRLMRSVYPLYFSAKLWLKSKTPVGRFASLKNMELVEPATQ